MVNTIKGNNEEITPDGGKLISVDFFNKGKFSNKGRINFDIINEEELGFINKYLELVFKKIKKLDGEKNYFFLQFIIDLTEIINKILTNQKIKPEDVELISLFEKFDENDLYMEYVYLLKNTISGKLIEINDEDEKKCLILENWEKFRKIIIKLKLNIPIDNIIPDDNLNKKIGTILSA